MNSQSVKQDYCIYALIDPFDNAIKYIGRTRNPKERYNAHFSSTYGDGTKEKCNWIQDLRTKGLRPIMKIIEESLTKEIAHERERYWIRFHHKQGCKLYNNVSLKIKSEDVVSLLEEYHQLLENSDYQDQKWIEAKEDLQSRTGEILEELKIDYQLRPFIRNQRGDA